MESPFPPHVSFCALSENREPEAPEHPLELAQLGSGACERRRQEFVLGRAAAHQAIAGLRGDSSEPIRRGDRGEPLWPAGLVGSISHTAGLAVAAVARRDQCAGLGVDVERRDRRTRPEVARLVASLPEQAWIGEAEARERLLLLFSAKEALFKALYPQAQVYLGYLDAELSWEEGDGFRAVLRREAAPDWPAGSTLRIGSRRHPEHVLSWVCLPA